MKKKLMPMKVLVPLVTFSMILLVQSSSFAQYKIKKDIIYNEKEQAVGKIVGVSNLAESNFKVYTTTGEKILSVKREEFKTPNPFYYNLYWYHIRFEDSGKDMMLEMNMEYSKKGVINKSLARAGFVFEDKPIANQDEIIANYSIQDSFTRDTTMIMTKHRQMVKLIKEHEVIRNRTTAVSFEFENEVVVNKIPISTWLIHQDEKIIGRIKKEWDINAATNKNYKYTVYEKFDDGEGMQFVPIGFGYLSDKTISFKTVIDNKEHVLQRGNTANKDEPGYTFLNFLVANNYL